MIFNSFITSAQITQELGFAIEQIDCEAPADIEVGTVYECVGVSDGVDYGFRLEITGPNAFVLSGGTPVD